MPERPSALRPLPYHSGALKEIPFCTQAMAYVPFRATQNVHEPVLSRLLENFLKDKEYAVFITLPLVLRVKYLTAVVTLVCLVGLVYRVGYLCVEYSQPAATM